MAKQPTWLDKINFIRFWLSNPCDKPYTVYFETAAKPTGNLVVSLLTFGMLDLVRSFFRPKGLRSKRHGRKSRRGGKPLFPELSDEVAKKTPGHEPVKARKVTDGVKNLWKIDNVGQRFFYYVQIFDVVLNWWFEWQSAIIRDDRSRCPNLARGLSETDLDVQAVGNNWKPFTPEMLVYQYGGVDMTLDGAFVPAGKFMVVAASKIGADPQTIYERLVQLRIKVDGAQPKKWFYGEKKQIYRDTEDYIVNAYVIGPARVHIESWTDRGTVFWSDMTCFVMQVGE